MFLGKNGLLWEGVIVRGGIETDVGDRRLKRRFSAETEQELTKTALYGGL
jgi:hypothetical protein